MNQVNPEILANATEIYADIKRDDGEPYRPANGTEGDIFEYHWCRRCCNDNEDAGIYCEILSLAYLGEQPEEWVYAENKPVCTAFSPQQ